MTPREKRAATYGLITTLILCAVTGCACVLVSALAGSAPVGLLGLLLMTAPMIMLDDMRTKRHDVEVRR